MRRKRPVARKGHQAVFMPEVLRPRLELLRVELQFIGELDEGVAEQVRIEIGQGRRLKGRLEESANRVRFGAMFASAAR
jgi:hypothetical protein